MIEEISASGKGLFPDHGPRLFESLWHHPAPWFEEPNHRRGGWSGVSRIELTDREGKTTVAYLKRHENHTYRAAHTLLRKAPTLRREFNNLRALDQAGFNVPQPLYFGTRHHDGRLQAMLVMKELPAFQSLNDYVAQCQAAGSALFGSVIAAIATEIARLHKLRWTHRCLYPKHTYVRVNPNSSVDVAFLDLETARKCPLILERQRLKELGPLYRRCRSIGVSRQDCVRFMKHYLGIERLDDDGRDLAHKIVHSKKGRARPKARQTTSGSTLATSVVPQHSDH
jgi:hypothetical protein